jgi:hypothetical protein
MPFMTGPEDGESPRPEARSGKASGHSIEPRAQAGPRTGWADTRKVPEGLSHCRTALSNSLSPQTACGHSSLLCLTGAVSATKLSVAVSKHPQPPPAKHRQPPACLAGGLHKLPGLALGCLPASLGSWQPPQGPCPHGVTILSRSLSPSAATPAAPVSP